MSCCASAGTRRFATSRLGFGLAAALLGLAAPAAAQDVPFRSFPATALRGMIEVTQPPEVKLNGQPARLSPGSRIRGRHNLLLMSAALVNQPLLVHYTFDTLGNVHLVWVLTPEEAARKPWPTTPEEAARWTFNPAEQTWTKP